jgi:SAM-dependent methyltransferase
MINVKLDAWVQQILCDPLSKSRLRVDHDGLVSDYGRRYVIVDGVYDLRVLTSFVGPLGNLWQAGQAEYELYIPLLTTKWSCEKYAVQRRGVEDVYRDITITGRCLDVGGGEGLLRAFLSRQQEYISIDPYLEVVKEPRSPDYKQVYPFVDEPLNFLAAFAEHLPFLSRSFDVVHMRSVIDHLLNPELALREAFRVLKEDGSLIVGLYVKGGKSGRVDLPRRSKDLVKAVLAATGFSRFKDSHMWHPTYGELCGLITDSGFRVDKTHWQKSEQEQVCYIRAIKRAQPAHGQ